MPTFDTVCEPDMVEVKNAVANSSKEIDTRFDFKGTAAAISLNEKQIVMLGDADFQLQQIADILRNKLTKRGVDIRFLDLGEVQKVGGDKVQQNANLHTGISTATGKKIQKALKESKLKVQASLQGDSVRVSGAKRDDLQAAMAIIKKENPDLPLSFDNFRD